MHSNQNSSLKQLMCDMKVSKSYVSGGAIK